MGILDKIKRVADPRARVVAADMKRLDEVQRGLGDKATTYILSGDDETVLSTLATKCAGTELEVCQSPRYHHRKDPPTWSRRKLLAQDHHPYDVDFAKRYAEVLSASCKDVPEHAAGSSHTDRLIRLFFSEAFSGLRNRTHVFPAKPITLKGKGLTLDNAKKMVSAFGGSMVDLVDVLYHEQARYYSITGTLYRGAVDIKPLAVEYAREFVEAGKRVHANSRAKIIQDLHEFGLADTDAYRDFVLQMAGDSSKAVREMAGSVLSGFDPNILEPKAIELLGQGNVATRAGMVELLAKIGTDSALDALRAHKETEKTARIVSAIETTLTVSSHAESNTESQDDEHHYQAIDGTVVEIPPLRTIPQGDSIKFGEEDRNALLQVIRDENERIKKQNENNKKQGYKYRRKPLSEGLANQALKLFNANSAPTKEIKHHLNAFLTWGPATAWTRQAVARLSQYKALRIAAGINRSLHGALSPYGHGPFVDVVRDYINGPNGDIRYLERLESEVGAETTFGYSSDRLRRKVMPGDFLRYVIQDDYGYMEPQFDNVPAEALWPYLAQCFDVIDEAFGLRPQQGVKLNRIGAIRVLYRLPKPPARYFGQLLEAATGETKGGRPEARAMLADAPNVAQHVVALLDDSRQAVRAGAAEWIAERNDVTAIPNLKARLKKEKSELAKAAILTTLDALGEDLSGFVGPTALLQEAEAGLKKAKLDKLTWLNFDHLPKVRYRSDQPVPDEVLTWWLVLAVKLKQPGGNALFDIYLNRLNPEDAQMFSNWVLDSWYNFDTARPSDEQGHAYAKQNLANRFQYMVKWVEGYTKEQAYEELKREFMANYLNSGAAFKGLLALAKLAVPAIAADRVRTYLKNHGSRTSQASSLLELLAAIGDPVTLQVVIAAATRLKQKGVQKFAGGLIEKVAEAKSWSLDELADRTVPSAGLDEDGILSLPSGPEEKPYRATIGQGLTLEVRNPDGKVIKSLPSGQDDATKASKKQLSASRRELKQVVAMQSTRMYEALCSARQWATQDWLRDISEHPIMRRITERIVWLGLDEQDEIVGSFRPTEEGDYTNADDEDVDVAAFSTIKLAHGALMEESTVRAWEQHLQDYEVKSLFPQFGRELLKLSEAEKTLSAIDDRKGWVTDTFTFRGGATKLGYERGEAMDGGYFNEYTKGFPSAGLLAVIEFSGNCLPEENAPAAMISLSFERYSSGRRTGGTMKLSDVPPVLLSECWNDYREIVSKAAFDENWEQKMPWM